MPTDSIPCIGARRLDASRADIARWLAAEALGESRRESSRSPDGVAAGGVARPRTLAAIAFGALADGWLKRPAQDPLHLLHTTAEALLAPTARSHPWALVSVAAAAGAAAVAAVVAGRPWRWLLRPAVLVSVASQITRLVLAKNTNRPTRSSPD